MNVAILGGSFNPPHLCHVFICYYVLATSDIQQVWIVPCYKHAFGKELVSFHHRFSMCCIAIESIREELAKVLSIEKDRRGTSWTIETVHYLKHLYPRHDFTWIIGSDMLNELKKWKDFDQLQQIISFLVVPRAGFLKEMGASSYNFETQGFQLPNISSTLIRERIRQNKPITHLVPKRIEEYIRKHNLYNE